MQNMQDTNEAQDKPYDVTYFLWLEDLAFTLRKNNPMAYEAYKRTIRLFCKEYPELREALHKQRINRERLWNKLQRETKLRLRDKQKDAYLGRFERMLLVKNTSYDQMQQLLTEYQMARKLFKSSFRHLRHEYIDCLTSRGEDSAVAIEEACRMNQNELRSALQRMLPNAS